VTRPGVSGGCARGKRKEGRRTRRRFENVLVKSAAQTSRNYQTPQRYFNRNELKKRRKNREVISESRKKSKRGNPDGRIHGILVTPSETSIYGKEAGTGDLQYRSVAWGTLDNPGRGPLENTNGSTSEKKYYGKNITRNQCRKTRRNEGQACIC